MAHDRREARLVHLAEDALDGLLARVDDGARALRAIVDVRDVPPQARPPLQYSCILQIMHHPAERSDLF